MQKAFLMTMVTTIAAVWLANAVAGSTNGG